MEEMFKAKSKEEILAIAIAEKTLVETTSSNERSFQRQESNLVYANEEIDSTKAVTGMSTMTLNTVGAAVDAVHTHLVKQLLSDKKPVIMTPVNGAYTEMADQATRILNHIIHKENDGFGILNTWLKSALINKNGILHTTWKESKVVKEKEFNGIFPEEWNVVEQDLTAKGFKTEVTEVVNNEDGSMNLTVLCEYMEETPIFENVLPEDFYINEGATAIDIDGNNCSFVAQSKLYSIGSIVAMFPKLKNKMDEISGGRDNTNLNSEEKYTRNYFDDSYDESIGSNKTGTRQDYEVIESWIRVDTKVEKLGYCKWVRLLSIGTYVVELERWDANYLPFSNWTPWMIPHKFYGQSVFDRLKKYYSFSTSILRGKADNIMMMNTPRYLAPQGSINLPDFQNLHPGVINVSRNTDPRMIVPVVTAPGAPDTLQLLQYMDQQVIAEIGISPITGMVSNEIEKSGNDSDKMQQAIDQGSAKIEKFLREATEGGLKELAWQLWCLIVDNSDSISVKKLVKIVDGPESDGMLIGAQPQFKDYMKRSFLTCKVGLGHKSATEKTRDLGSIMQLQNMLIQSGLPVDDKSRWELAQDIITTSGNEGKYLQSYEELAQLKQAMDQAQQQQSQMLEQTKQAAITAGVDKLKSETAENQVDAQVKLRKTNVAEQDLQRKIVKDQAEFALEAAQDRPVAIG